MAVSDVKALTFDVFGTVVNWRDSIAREAKNFLGPKGYEKDWHAFADRWRARYQPAMEKVRKGERPWARLDDLHRENLVVRPVEVISDISYLFIEPRYGVAPAPPGPAISSSNCCSQCGHCARTRAWPFSLTRR